MTIEQFIQGAVPLAADFDGRRLASPSGSSVTITAGNLGLHEGPVFAGNPIALGLPTQPYSLVTLSSTIQLTGVSGQLQTKESLAGNIASTQKKTALGTIEKAPNGQNMIVGPVTLDYFGKGNLFQPTTRTPAETDALNAEEKNKLLSELNAALGLDSTATAPKPVTVDPESTAADLNS